MSCRHEARRNRRFLAGVLLALIIASPYGPFGSG